MRVTVYMLRLSYETSNETYEGILTEKTDIYIRLEHVRLRSVDGSLDLPEVMIPWHRVDVIMKDNE